MIENIKNVINQFSIATLEGIQKIGRYEIRGFRIGGPRSLIKEQRLKTELAKKKDILETIKKYADQQLNEGHLDNTWTFVSEIDTTTINKKVNNSKTDYVLLELISNNKYDVINNFLNQDKYKHTEGSQFKNNDLSEKSIENNKMDYEKKIQYFEKALRYNENQKNDLMKKNNILKDKINHEKKRSEMKLFTIEKEIKLLKEENENIKTNNQLINICILGGEKLEKWFEKNNRLNQYNFIFCNIENEDISSYKKTNELWIIKPFINNNDRNLIKQCYFISILNKLQKVFIFKNLEEVRKHMDYQEAIK